MTKNIVLCSDGTGSKGMQKRGTNVYKLFEAVDLHGHKKDCDLTQQIAFYDDGVGTESVKLLKILGGAFGWGLSRNVRQLYANLVRTYDKEDRIYLFGFSRGAFTVRTLAGLINTCGILDRTNFKTDAELVKEVKRVYGKYRRKYGAWLSLLFYCPRKVYHYLRRKFCVTYKENKPLKKAPIEFIGVWDTVDAVGVPIMWLADIINTCIYRFKFVDSKLSSKEKVRKVCHALSIDDERFTFHPVLWDEKGEEDSRIEQVWFAGVHSNVGGGYSKHGMSLVSLDWMMTMAEQVGLKFNADTKLRFIDHDRELYRDHRNVTDKLYDSRSGIGVYYRYKPRNIGKKCHEHHIKPKIHNSVIERILQRTEGYAPGNIPFDCEFVSTEGNDENYDDFIQVFRKHLDGETSLLDRVKRWVLIRRKFHSAFLISSIIAFSTFMYIEIPELGFFGTLGKLFTITGLMQIATNLLAKPILSIIAVAIPVIITIVLFVIVRILRMKMNLAFSEFWCTHLQKLQTIMNNPENIK